MLVESSFSLRVFIYSYLIDYSKSFFFKSLVRLVRESKDLRGLYDGKEESLNMSLRALLLINLSFLRFESYFNIPSGRDFNINFKSSSPY